MEITRFSASAFKVFEVCPARFNAEYVQRARTVSGTAADRGTAVHEALMKWTVEDHMDFDFKLLHDRFVTESAKMNLSADDHEQCVKMLRDCFDRLNENPPYQILAVEEKEVVNIKVDGRDVELVYIWDRCDLREDQAINVVDYKSWYQNLPASEIKKLIQVQLYALTAAIKYKDRQPPAIWVTLDQLRYGVTAVKFTKDDLRESFTYVKDVIRRIWADDGTTEQVNPECRYCIRRDSCQSLERVQHVNPEGVLATDDFDTIAEQMAETYEAIKTLNLMMEEYEDWLDGYLEENRIPEATTSNGIVVKYNATSRRKVDSERLGIIVGPEIAQRYGKFSMEDVDALLKGDEIDEKTKELIKKHIQTNISTRVIARYPKK